jgi:hypothetical protein
MSGALQVKNWSRFQHYKDRNPPWIKLATDTFQNVEFSRLQSASKLLAICIWTLASRSKDGTVVDDLDYILQWGFLVGQAHRKNLDELVNIGFIVRDSGLLELCKQDAIPETEAYKPNTVETESCFDVLWKLWPRHDGKAETLSKYKAVCKDQTGLILERAHKQIALWEKEGQEKRFIPMLKTWLHQRRFDTEPEFMGERNNGNGKVKGLSGVFEAYAAANGELAGGSNES